jgi:DNA-binding MarR family transcriptional regulator
MQIAKKYSFNSHNLHSIRHWEKQNLPHYGKEVGYLLFLELATFNGINSEALKAFNLSMPYAESTVRLLLRKLENDGWIQVIKFEKDKRMRNFKLTDQFLIKRAEWLCVIENILLEH